MTEIGNWADYACPMRVSAENTEAECLGPVSNEQAAKEVAQNAGSSTAEVN